MTALQRYAKASDAYVSEILTSLKKTGGRKLSAQQKIEKMATLLKDRNDGFRRLGQQMIGPIQLKLRYQGLARNVLMEDPLTPGVPIEYDVLDDMGQAYTLHGGAGEVKITPFEGKRLNVELFRIAAFPQIKKEDLYYMRANVVEHARDESRQAIQKQEDARLVTLIDAAISQYQATTGNTSTVTATGGYLTPEVLYDAAAYVDERELESTRLLFNPRSYRDLFRWDINQTGWAFKDRVVAGEKVLEFGEFTIGRSTMIPANTVFLTPDPEFLGVMPVMYSLDVEENNKVESFHKGWVMDELIGMAILNPKGLIRINITQ